MIKRIWVFYNGMVAVCDERGEQMPEFQGRYQDVVGRLRGEDLSRATIEVSLWRPENRRMTPAELFALEHGPDGQLVEGGSPYGGQYLPRDPLVATDGEIAELKIFLCRGGGVELIGLYQERGERGPLTLMIAGDDERVARLREVAREQMRSGIWSDFRLCRFVNAGTVEVIGRDWQVIE